MRKSAWIGAHSSAKTTTVNRLAWFLKQEGKTVFMVREVPRDIPPDLSINQDAGFAAQRWMVEEQIRRELKCERDALLWERGNDTIAYILCDRSIWDYLAYSLTLLNGGKMSSEEFEKIRELVLFSLNILLPYDKIYFCEMKPLYDDGVRDLDEAWRDNVHNSFKKIIKDYQLDVVTVQ